MAKLFANSEDPDQTPCSMGSDLGLHCLHSTLLRVSWVQWVKYDLPVSLHISAVGLEFTRIHSEYKFIQDKQTQATLEKYFKNVVSVLIS